MLVPAALSSSNTPSMTHQSIRLFVLSLVSSTFLHAADSAAPIVIDDFNQPFLFSYMSWDKKARTENGVAILRGINNQGGAGLNGAWNLADKTDLIPSLRLRVGPGNQAAKLKLMLRDDAKGDAVWEFPLPAPGKDFILVSPAEGASLGQPNESGKEGKLNLTKITQLQLIGDWAGGKAVDLEVDAVVLVTASGEILAARAERAKRLAAEAEALRKQQQELIAKYGKRSDLSPNVDHVSAVAPDVLAVEIQVGKLIPAKLVKYEALPGDKKVEKKAADGSLETVLLERNGKTLGWLIGPKYDQLTTYEEVTGDPLLEFLAADPANFRLGSKDDSAFKTPLKPMSIGRKSHVNGWAQGPGTLAIRHTFYLRLPKPLAAGKTYTLEFGQLNTRQAAMEFAFDPALVRSEAVHVNQIGYRPDDLAKRAMVSCWLGTGGVLKLPESLDFSLVEDAGSKVVFQGKGERHFPADKVELMARDANFNGTDVARWDFSAFNKPGRYRVVLDGVGCSYPFEIKEDVWEKAFLTQMRGLFHQRSGVKLGPPHTDFDKPRDMNPEDGYRVTRTKFRCVEDKPENYKAIVAGDTGEIVPGWGGYHDAGDWNPRRVTHMKITLAMLEMFDLYPKYFSSLKFNIPQTDGLPDLLTECLFEFNCFRRLQAADGGIPYGMESKADPYAGEVSWLNSFSTYVFSPDYAGSWYYASVGARLARLLEPYDKKQAAEIRESAEKAMAFGEQDYARDFAAGLTAKRGETWTSLDNRNLAALELYQLTRDSKYHEIFLKDTVIKDAKPELFAWGKAVQRDAAFAYARLPDGLGDPAMKKKAVTALTEMAERCFHFAGNNAFNLTSPDKTKPQFLGFYTTPDAFDLTRAHFLTGDARFLAGAVQSTQFQSGCNPNNLVYITGLGANPVKNVFKLDARRTGQPVPAGLVPYGNIDFTKWNDNGFIWPITWVIGKATVPDAYAWPTTQAYWDLGGWPMLEEFTVDNWTPNVLVWGYLAARGG